MDLKEIIAKMKAKGMTNKEIKEILDISNHDIYDRKDNPKSKKDQKLDVGQRPTEKKENPAQGITEPSQTKESQENSKEAKPEIEDERSKVENSEGFSTMKISSNRAVNDLARQQELCLKALIKRIDQPFRDKWEWTEWHRLARALQLSQHIANDLFLDFEGMWHNLIEGEADRDMREFVVFAIHNYLEETFALARKELAEREKETNTE